MRQVINGLGLDSTAATAAWLSAGKNITLGNLILIGEPEHPQALWLTDFETPLLWPCWGTFYPAVIKRGSVTSAIGLQVQSLSLTWTPPNSAYTQTVSNANPYQLAKLGFYDNWLVRVWTVYMPTPGDAATFGASELFGGRIADSTVARGSIVFTVNSFLDVVNEQVPTNVIELTNTVAAYTAATPPKGFSNIPQFAVIQGSSNTQVIGDQTFPVPHSILNTNVARQGFLAFNTGPGNTLGGFWSAIAQNTEINTLTPIGGRTTFNQFLLNSPLPWPPTPGVDTFYVSGAAPIDQSDGDYFGFPYVPDPATAV
jgi:hypothetical protein